MEQVKKTDQKYRVVCLCKGWNWKILDDVHHVLCPQHKEVIK